MGDKVDGACTTGAEAFNPGKGFAVGEALVNEEVEVCLEGEVGEGLEFNRAIGGVADVVNNEHGDVGAVGGNYATDHGGGRLGKEAFGRRGGGEFDEASGLNECVAEDKAEEEGDRHEVNPWDDDEEAAHEAVARPARASKGVALPNVGFGGMCRIIALDHCQSPLRWYGKIHLG